jgi:hypothetical protein
LYELRRAAATFETTSYWKLTLADNILQLDKYYKRIVEGNKSGIIDSGDDHHKGL